MIVNLTPHDVVLYDEDNNIVHTFTKCKSPPPRLKETLDYLFEVDGFPVYKKTYGFGSLPPNEKKEVWYIVSLIIAQSFPDRLDLLIVNERVKNDKGQIIGCRSFARVSG